MDKTKEPFFNQLDEILKFILNNGSTYPDKIKEYFNLTEKEVSDIFHKLSFDGYIEKLLAEDDVIIIFQLSGRGKWFCLTSSYTEEYNKEWLAEKQIKSSIDTNESVRLNNNAMKLLTGGMVFFTASLVAIAIIQLIKDKDERLLIQEPQLQTKVQSLDSTLRIQIMKDSVFQKQVRDSLNISP